MCGVFVIVVFLHKTKVVFCNLKLLDFPLSSQSVFLCYCHCEGTAYIYPSSLISQGIWTSLIKLPSAFLLWDKKVSLTSTNERRNVTSWVRFITLNTSYSICKYWSQQTLGGGGGVWNKLPKTLICFAEGVISWKKMFLGPLHNDILATYFPINSLDIFHSAWTRLFEKHSDVLIIWMNTGGDVGSH